MDNNKNKGIESIKLHSYSDIIFFWPLEIPSIILLILSLIPVLQDDSLIRIFSWIWIWIFISNLLIVAFDFSSSKAFSLVALFIVIFLILIILSTFANLNILQDVLIFLQMPVDLNWAFYTTILIIFSLLFLIAFISSKISYVEITGNEIFVKQGILAERIALSTDRMEISKVINDVFEYLIFRSGDLVIRTSSTSKFQTMRLQNIINIGKKIDIINHIVSITEVNSN